MHCVCKTIIIPLQCTKPNIIRAEELYTTRKERGQTKRKRKWGRICGGKRKTKEKKNAAIPFGLPRVVSVHHWVMGSAAFVAAHSLSRGDFTRNSLTRQTWLKKETVNVMADWRSTDQTGSEGKWVFGNPTTLSR